MDTVHRRPRFLERALRFALTNRVATGAASALSAGYATVFLLHRFAEEASTGRGFPIPTLVRYFEWLRARRYNIIGLPTLVDALAAGRKLPARTVVFTVDDGYSDFHDVALPHFRRFEIPVSVFLVTDFLDGKCWLWWDKVEAALLADPDRQGEVEIDGRRIAISPGSREERQCRADDLVEHLKTLPGEERDTAIGEICRSLEVTLPPMPPLAYAPMTWNQVRTLNGDLVTFGPHTLTHPILALESDVSAKHEVTGSWERLRAEVPGALPVFCYPNGDPASFGGREVSLVTEAGLDASLSVFRQPVAATAFAESGALRRRPIPRYALEEDFGRFVQLASGTERIKAAVFGSGRR